MQHEKKSASTLDFIHFSFSRANNSTRCREMKSSHFFLLILYQKQKKNNVLAALPWVIHNFVSVCVCFVVPCISEEIALRLCIVRSYVQSPDSLNERASYDIRRSNKKDYIKYINNRRRWRWVAHSGAGKRTMTFIVYAAHASRTMVGKETNLLFAMPLCTKKTKH